MKYRSSFGVLQLRKVALLLGIESAQTMARQFGITNLLISISLAESPYSKLIASCLLSFCCKSLLASKGSKALPIPAKHQRRHSTGAEQ